MQQGRASRAREATLRDVAAAAGVSIWTASNTYGNPARVSEATRQRVLAAARELGYVGPHPGARSLARGRSKMIAVVAPGDAELLLSDPAASLVTRGLLTACSWAGYSLVLSGSPSGQIADGRVFFRAVPEADGRVPGVVVDGPPAPGAEHAVSADVRGAAAALAGHLHELGHRRLAVLTWPGAEARLAGVEDGWRGEAPRVLAIDPRDGPGERDDRGPSRAAGEALARAALAQRPRPTAVLALSDTFALSVLETANWMGLRVPEDVSVAGLDDLPGSDAVGLTTALIPYRSLGERAGDALLAMLGGDAPASAPDLPTALSIRRTTGPPPR